MHPMLNIAIRAAHRAGTVISRKADRVDTLTVSSKGLNDYVSEVDRMAEETIIDTLKTAYPDHGIIAEESGVQEGNEYTWIIDPLDGTTNFLHGFPQFSVSIALVKKGVLDQAVVHDPMRDETFTASRGNGAWLNSRRIRVSKRISLEGALLGTGFPYRDLRYLDAYLALFKELIAETAGIRRPGSAALDLAYLACGRIDGFWEVGLKAWDIAAGALIIQEAGGFVSDFEGKQNFLQSGRIVAAPVKIHGIMLEKIKPYLAELSV